MDESDKGEEMNPMEWVSNNGEKNFRLQSEEYCSDEIPKCLTRKKCVVIWQAEHSCAAIDLV
jgi:hypothetical protein